VESIGVHAQKLGKPDAAAENDQRQAREADDWRKRRLLAAKLATQGDYPRQEVTELCGVARGSPSLSG